MADIYSRPWDLANLVLAAIVAEFALADVELPGVQFVSNGDVPQDDELLAVALNRMYGVSMSAGVPAEEVAAQRCTMWRAAQYEIVLVRCAPVIEDHPIAGNPRARYNLVEESARQVMYDGMIVTRGILRAYRAETFGLGPNLAFEDWAALEPTGGIVGGRLLVRIGLV